MHLQIIVILLCLVGCSHIGGVKAPEREHTLELAKNNSFEDLDESETIALKYLKAQEKTFESCMYLTEIAGNKEFPLSELAKIKSLEICDFPPEKLTEIWQQKATVPKWLEKRFVETSLELAKHFSMSSFIADFTIDYLSFLKLQKEKEEAIYAALTFARKAKDRDSALKLEEKLYQVSPRLKKFYTDSDLYEIARDFEKNRSFTKARRLYNKIIHGRQFSIDEKMKAWGRYRLSYKIERDKKTYLAYTERMVSFLKKEYKKTKDQKTLNYLIDGMITLSRAQWTEHQAGTAQKTLESLLRNYTVDKENMALTYWLIGSIRLEAKDYNQSTAYFEKAIALNPKSETITWSLGWNYYTVKDDQKLVNIFETYLKETNDDSQRFKYWLAKAYKRLGNEDKAEDLFEEVIENDPLEYYSFLSHYELGQTLDPITKVNEIDPLKDETFDWLYSLGEFDVAKQYLDSKRREWKESKLRVASLPLYKKIGHYDAMISQVYSLSQESRRELIEENPTYAFPTPYKEEVRAAAKKFNVEPELIYAISRQESAFNQHARSWADAFGVMQIIPEKAKILGQRYQIPYRSHDDLFTPQTNVLLGASLLNELNKMFDGIFPLYVASYNASDSAVRKWYKERYSGDLIEFIEMIPYAETRKYVKLVMRNFFIYKKINSSESIEFTTNFFTSQAN